MAASSRARCDEAISTALTPCTLQVHGVRPGYEERARLRAVVRPPDALREGVERRRDDVLVLRDRDAVVRRRRVVRAPAGLRSLAGTSSRITAPDSVTSWRPRNACMRSSSRRI